MQQRGPERPLTTDRLGVAFPLRCVGTMRQADGSLVPCGKLHGEVFGVAIVRWICRRCGHHNERLTIKAA
jgi:hypothetical protein